MRVIEETVTGIVNRVTYHSESTGWSVLRVNPFNSPESQVTVTVHQTKVFAGATMEFIGQWSDHPKFGRQFKAERVTEKKPATAAALELYLGSGLIKGVGPKTAKKIVKHFAAETLTVFERNIDRLVEVEGIASKKLKSIEKAWSEHKAIREVMMFLQGHGISTLFAVRIYKDYGDRAIEMVTEDPYRLAHDFYGIGFFSADKVALSIGLAKDSRQRIVAAIRHVLASSREQGHCYLMYKQIEAEANTLLEMELGELLGRYLEWMQQENHLRVRMLPDAQKILQSCYYSKSLYYDEESAAAKMRTMIRNIDIDKERVAAWVQKYCQNKDINLSSEQANAVEGVVQHQFSILTGGPGCGKTTATLVIVRLLEAIGKRVLLAAPTGRAAQRMGEVIGREAKTLHRLLEWQGGEFKKNEEFQLEGDFLIVDECSMLDISMTASLLKAIPEHCQLLFIGDPDQLPSVGAGNVLKDSIHSGEIPIFRLTQVFRQAKKSLIIRYAHQINSGEIPLIASPFKDPDAWQRGDDCLFVDSDEATQEQIRFVTHVKQNLGWQQDHFEALTAEESPYDFRSEEPVTNPYQAEFEVPKKFLHVNLQEVAGTYGAVDELKSVLKKIHPWSSLHYGLSAVDVVVKLYLLWIPKYQQEGVEIQILSPMTRGALGTANLNCVIQQAINPSTMDKPQIKVGERIFRVGDRVIHRRNNYDLEVFNGDIGYIKSINNESLTMVISFLPDGREVEYLKENIVELDLAYAITIHKSQGSEFSVVIIPVLTQHFKMLYRNLIYTGLTRAKKLAVFVGTRRAMAMAVRQQDTAQRQTALKRLLMGN